jgi:hypothetical protein
MVQMFKESKIESKIESKKEELPMEKEERLSGLLKEAEGHPMMKAILAEKADKVLGERLLVAAKLRAATEEAERVIPERQKDVDALVADLAEYDEGRKAVLDKLTAARGELATARQSLEWERSHAEAALLSNYDPRIDEAITFFRDRFEGLRVKHINSQKRTGETNIYTEKQEVFVYSNAAAIKNALAYCRTAIDELERMKLTPHLDADRIEALRKGIPDADELMENAGEKPMEGSRGFNPLHLLKSDDQLSWEIGKIGEKFKKVMTGR